MSKSTIANPALPTPALFEGGIHGFSRVRLAIVVNFITSYREGFYRRLLATEGVDVTIYCHEPPPHLNLNCIHHLFPKNVRIISGKFIFGEKVVFSGLPWREFFSDYDAVYVEGNPRYLSLALLATLLQLTGRRVVLKAMVHSFRNSRLSRSIRLWWYRLFSNLLVYSDAEAAYLGSLGFRGKIIGINNGMDCDRISQAIQAWPSTRLTAWRDERGFSDRILMLSCARLEKKNKFDQVLQALPRLLKDIPNLIWCVIGDGPERHALEQLARQLDLTANVFFLNKIYDENDLAPWFLSSRLLVHPGAIGLTLLHSMSFGVPVVTHRDARRHGPEFSAMVAGAHGLTYGEDEIDELIFVIRELLVNEKRSHEMGMAGKALVHKCYNTRVMVERFLLMLDHSDMAKS